MTIANKIERLERIRAEMIDNLYNAKLVFIDLPVDSHVRLRANEWMKDIEHRISGVGLSLDDTLRELKACKTGTL